MTGELMTVAPVVIDLGWGELKSAIVKLTQTDFVATQSAGDDMRSLVNQYVAAFRKVEVAANSEARTLLNDLERRCVEAHRPGETNGGDQADRCAAGKAFLE